MSFFKNAVKPRLRKILTHRNSAVSFLVAFAVWIAFGQIRLPSTTPSISVLDAAGPILTFTAMGFAVAVTALALILALPLNRAVALMLVNTENDEVVQVIEVDGLLMAANPKTNVRLTAIRTAPETSGYLNLVFVFVWTAVANVVASLTAIAAAVIVGNDLLLSSDAPVTHLIISVVAGTLTYATLQMFTALSTVFEVAEIFQAFSRRQLEVNALKGSAVVRREGDEGDQTNP